VLDPRSLERRRDEIAEACERRGVAVDLDGAIAAQHRVAALQTALGELNRRKNEHQAGGQRKLAPEQREAHAAEGRRLKEEGARLEADLALAERALEVLLVAIPNLVHPESPKGGEAEFRELRRVGEPRRFAFAPRDHLAIGEALGLLGFEAGARVAGQKWYFLRREAVLLDLALQRFALERAIHAGYEPYATPDVARRPIVDGLAFSPRGDETQIYSLAGTDLDLIGTAEITLGGLHHDQVLDARELPLRMVGVSHCFRTEAGAAGKESRGLYRVHQFTKVELFAITRPEESEAMHAELLGIEEEIFQALEIPYRVIEVAAGDLGAPAYRKFDLEAWMPGRGAAGEYGEVTSTSNCTDYQARRLRIRFRREDAKRTELVHTLNGTAIAVSRGLVALLENHQQADGSVTLPAALRPLAGFDRIGPR
jgi:seryl-tRNA synthetase